VIWFLITGSRRVLFPLPHSGKAKAFVEFLKTGIVVINVSEASRRLSHRCSSLRPG